MCGKWVSLLQHRKLTRARAPKFNKQVVSDERKRRRAGSNKQGKTRCSGTPVSKSTCEMQRRSSIGQLQFCPHPRGVQLPFHFLLCCKLWRLTVTNRICPPPFTSFRPPFPLFLCSALLLLNSLSIRPFLPRFQVFLHDYIKLFLVVCWSIVLPINRFCLVYYRFLPSCHRQWSMICKLQHAFY